MICLFDALLCHAFDWVEGSGQHNPQSSSLPHVDQVLGQGDGLSVAGDADGPVKVGGGVPVLAVGDTYHGSAYLSVKMFCEKSDTTADECLRYESAN